MNQSSNKIVRFGQVVIGPPGAGKTTYCGAAKEFLKGTGRKVVLVNLDPANDTLPYTPDINIADIVNLEEVIDILKLGPNGGLLYCMEFLEKNFNLLEEKLSLYEKEEYYFIFDCPGQVELFTHHNAVKDVIKKLLALEFRLAAVHLVDSHYCSDASKFISVLLTSLSTMLQIELPHVNVLSKMDLIERYGKLAFSMDYYTDVLDLRYILEDFMKDTLLKKFGKLNEMLVGIVEDYSLVSFSTLFVDSKESMMNLAKTIDKANGYIYGGLSDHDVMESMSATLNRNFQFEKNMVKDISEVVQSRKENIL